ncbi:hypothetical protein SAY87_015922 [Trapa incisa]|uniref:Wee1-like protein kinase n=1 Tax=Trapa incisa TaxID=236973 RepID=A0AAN7L5Y8_9MYRT|nr:hypothetical protein SAY87_015922 [Trapa incisa]
MKRKSFKRGGNGNRKRGEGKKMGGASAVSLQAPRQSSLFSFCPQLPPPLSPPFQNLQDVDSAPPEPKHPPLSAHESEAPDANFDFILSQDFFCTPDYITPDNQNVLNSIDSNKENAPCPKSPEKMKSVSRKRSGQGPENFSLDPLSPSLSGIQQIEEVEEDDTESDLVLLEKASANNDNTVHRYVPQSAVALRCRAMPPPCFKNPYLNEASDLYIDPFSNRRSKCAGFFPAMIGGDGLSRYHTDFHEIEQIGCGNFSRVFKVLKRIDGCLYAVKHNTRTLHQETDRRKALMEVQVLAALGSHKNITGYYSSWFENEHLYIQMELCDYSLSVRRSFHPFTENEALGVLYQIAKALEFIHNKGVAHLDVKPDNIYVKSGVHKLGDFGCATLLNRSLPIEEGDARYMPREILNDDFDHLDKVDIFSLGVSIYELVSGSPLPDSGLLFHKLKEGKLPLLPGHSLQFQNLLKMMVDPNPDQRPSATHLLHNPIFDRIARFKKI